MLFSIPKPGEYEGVADQDRPAAIARLSSQRERNGGGDDAQIVTVEVVTQVRRAHRDKGFSTVTSVSGVSRLLQVYRVFAHFTAVFPHAFPDASRPVFTLIAGCSSPIVETVDTGNRPALGIGTHFASRPIYHSNPPSKNCLNKPSGCPGRRLLSIAASEFRKLSGIRSFVIGYRHTSIFDRNAPAFFQ
jgi:hypothetical protein